MTPKGPPPPPPVNPVIRHVARLASPEPWPPPELDDGTTYTRSEVLVLIAVTRQTNGELGGRDWAVAMLTQYDANTREREADARIGR